MRHRARTGGSRTGTHAYPGGRHPCTGLAGHCVGRQPGVDPGGCLAGRSPRTRALKVTGRYPVFPLTRQRGCHQGESHALAQVFENLRATPCVILLRGEVSLVGRPRAGRWHLTTRIRARVPESARSDLRTLSGWMARDRSGFGPGPSIASRAVHRLDGDMCVRNAHPGLRVYQLPAADPV